MNALALAPAAHVPSRTLLVVLVSAVLALAVGFGLGTVLASPTTDSAPAYVVPGGGSEAEADVRGLMHLGGSAG